MNKQPLLTTLIQDVTHTPY